MMLPQMDIVVDYPPLWDEIDAAFHVAGREVLFAWGSCIYNPQGIVVPPELIVHEHVHGQRQGEDITGWWRRYIEDPRFRAAEEIPAHQAEYKHLQEHAPRDERRRALKQIAARLSGPLYGRVVSPGQARQLLRAAA